jgi:hypothetical protein
VPALRFRPPATSESVRTSDKRLFYIKSLNSLVPLIGNSAIQTQGETAWVALTPTLSRRRGG